MTITTPTGIAGLKQWLDASQETVYANGDPVGTAHDWSGGTPVPMTATGTARPTWVTGAQNGLPCFRFDGTDDMISASLSDDAAVTIVCVMKKRSAIGFTTQTHWGTASTAAGINEFASRSDLGAGFIIYPNPSFGAVDIGGDPTIAQITALRSFDSGYAEYFLLGSRKGSYDPEDNFGSFDRVGIGGNVDTFADYSDIDCYEWLVYDSILTDKQMYDLMSYLGNKWGVAGHAPNLIANRGTAGNTTGATTTALTITNPTLIEVGSKLLLFIAVDNSGTAGAAPGVTSVVDSKGHTWTQRMVSNRTAASAANDGTTLYMYETTVVTAFVATNTVTVTWTTGSPPAKALILEEWARLGGVSVAAVYATGASTAPSRTAVPTAAGQAVIAALAVEGVLADTYTADVDTTNGYWQPVDRIASGGTTTSGQTIATQYKRVVASGTQTFNPTITSRDWSVGAIVYDVSAYPVSFTRPKLNVSGSAVLKPVKLNVAGVAVEKQMKINISGVAVGV